MQYCPSVQNGFRFACQQCGRCCRSETEGYIFVYQSDIEKLRDFLGISEREIAEKYLSITHYTFFIWNEDLRSYQKRRIMPTLIFDNDEMEDCIFLEEKEGKDICKIYEARPFQCMAFPFWSLIMTNEEEFQRTKQWCIGFEGHPHEDLEEEEIPFYSIEEIDKIVIEERKLERDFYLKMKDKNFNLLEVYPFLKGLKKFEDML